MTNWVVCTSLFYRSCTPKIGGFIKTIINEHHYEHTNISWISHQRSVQMICNISLLVSPLDISTVIQARICVQCVFGVKAQTTPGQHRDGSTQNKGLDFKEEHMLIRQAFHFTRSQQRVTWAESEPVSEESAFIRQRLSGFLTNRWLKWEVQPLAY